MCALVGAVLPIAFGSLLHLACLHRSRAKQCFLGFSMTRLGPLWTTVIDGGAKWLRASGEVAANNTIAPTNTTVRTSPVRFQLPTVASTNPPSLKNRPSSQDKQ